MQDPQRAAGARAETTIALSQPSVIHVEAAVATAVPADVLTAALYTRFRSRQEHTFAEKVLSAMRQKFGGHVEPVAAAKKTA